MDQVVEQVYQFAVLPNESVSEWMLADLALEPLPNVRVDHWRFFAVSLAFEPRLEARQSHVAH